MPTHAELHGALPFIIAGVASLLLRAVLTRSTHRHVVAAREVLLMIPVILLYFLARGTSSARPAVAIAHAESVIGLEQRLGIFVEPVLQRGVLWSPVAMDLANWTYVFGHWPVITCVFIWLALRHRERLPPYRNAIVLSGIVGIVIFLTWPVAPPRLVPGYGFVDTVLLRSRAYRVLQPAALTDLYASMPSLHVGWNLVMGIALVRESRHRAARIFGVLMPIAMFAAVVVTANHFILDVLAGVALVVAALALADRPWEVGRGR